MTMTLALAIALQILPAPGGIAWEQVSRDEDGRNSIDPASIRRSGETVRFMMRVDFHNPASFNGMHMLTMRLAFDCRQRTFSIEAADGYGEGGTLISSRQVPPAEAQPQPLSSITGHETMRARICGAGAG